MPTGRHRQGDLASSRAASSRMAALTRPVPMPPGRFGRGSLRLPRNDARDDWRKPCLTSSHHACISAARRQPCGVSAPLQSIIRRAAGGAVCCAHCASAAASDGGRIPEWARCKSRHVSKTMSFITAPLGRQRLRGGDGGEDARHRGATGPGALVSRCLLGRIPIEERQRRMVNRLLVPQESPDRTRD